MPSLLEAHPPLYAAVVANPDEDAPRLACADWYEQNGQPDRAQLIRIQCQCARLPEGDPERSALASPLERLVSQHRTTWLADRPVLAGVRWEFLRGFPE